MIGFIKWNRYGLCGAACVHMALHKLKPAFSADTLAQDDVWTSIKKHTNGRSKVPCCVAVPPQEQFDDMMRGARPGDTCAFCWWSYPTVMRAVLIDKLGKGTAVKVRKPPDVDAANDIIRSCLARGGVPIVLIYGGSHWVVVDDWDTTSQKFSLLDPANPGPIPMDVADWNGECMVTADVAGPYDNKHVVVEVG